MQESSFFEKIVKVQSDLKAPKGQYNSFGKYRYRSCEDILESVKPILAKYGLFINVSDDIMMVGDRYYIKATATISDGENKLQSTAYARESVEKKGMDESQVTGTASSYARKYALNGLLAIDDAKDADTDEYAGKASDKPSEGSQQSTPRLATPKQVEILKGRYTGDNLKKLLDVNHVKTIEELTMDKASELISKLQKKGE